MAPREVASIELDTSPVNRPAGTGCLHLSHESRGFVVILDADGTIAYANLEALRDLGVSIDVAVGSSIFSYVHAQDRQQAIATYLLLCNTPDGVATQTVRFESRSTGSIRDVDVQISNRLHLSTLHGIVMHGLDVTERNQFRADLYRSLEHGAGAVETVLQRYDSGSARHHQEVAAVATAIARAIGMTDDMINRINSAATLHDIGEISIPESPASDRVLQSSYDRERLRGHPQVGAAMVANAGLGGSVAQMILQHHERIDGSGFPDGLTGSSMLFGSQIIGLADIVAVMTMDIPDSRQRGPEAMLAHIESTQSRHFDSTIASACLGLLREEGFYRRVIAAHS